MQDQQRFIREALEAHNRLRSKHGASNLVHNAELSKIALSWAQYLASRQTLKHSTNKYNNQNIGENLAMWGSTGATHYDGERATMQWYNEIKDYNFSRGDFTSGTGHFTQVVWKSSRDVGFGVAQSSDGSFYAVANYFPAGNMIGQFKVNVLPLNSAPPVDSQQSSLQNNNPKTNIPNNYVINTDNNNFLSFRQEALMAHNELRRKHGALPLKHNPELSEIATKWANVLASRDSMRPSGNKYQGQQLGENIALYGNKNADKYDGKHATKQWYDTIKYHDFDKDFNENSSTFTQLVWRDTKEVGFGYARSSNGNFYAVANYYPSGNYDNQFFKNVFPIL